MNKLLMKVAGIALGLSLATGIGVAVGGRQAKAAYAASPANLSLSTKTWAEGEDYVSWSIVDGTTSIATMKSSGTNYSNYLGGDSNNRTSSRFYNGGTVTITPTTGISLGTITFTATSNNYASTFGTTSNWTNATASVSATKVTVTPTDGSSMISVSVKGTCGFTTATFAYSTAGSNTLSAPSPIFDRANNTITWAAVEHATSYQLKVDNGSYSTQSSGYSVASVSVNDAHTVYVKALANGYTTSDEGSVTFHRYATKGTDTDPYTVADARRAIDNNDGVTGVYATGIVSAIPTAYSSQYSNITFNFVDSKGDTDFLQAYHCAGTDAADVSIGDTVVVHGSLTKYNDTYEFGQGCTLTSLEHPVTPSVVFTRNYGYVLVGETKTYEAVGLNLGGNSITYSSSLTNKATIDSSTGAVTGVEIGDTVITASATVSGKNYDATYTLHVVQPRTIAQAKTAVDAGTELEDNYVIGYVSAIGELANGALTYYISDDGSTEGQFEVYKGKGLNGADFSATTDLTVGDRVVVYGKLKKYNSTYEFDTGSKIISKESQEPYTITVSVSDGTYTGDETIGRLASSTASITISANSHYMLPNTITVTGASYEYNASTGVVSLSNPTGNVSISATCSAATRYTITVTASHCTYSGADEIYSGNTATITFVADSGYKLPNSVTPTGASVQSWNSSTGVLVLENPSTNVTLTVSATENTTINTSGLVPGTYYIKYETHYFTGSISSGCGTTDVNKPNSNGEFVFSLVGDDTWTIVNGASKYLTIGSSSKSLGLSDEYSTLIVEKGDSTNTYKIKGSSGRYIAWYSSNSDFRTYADSSDLTLESVNATEYTITYNANGGTGNTMPNTVGTNPMVSQCSYTAPEGKTFLRWNTESDGSGEDYYPGSTVTEDINLYAIWAKQVGQNIIMSAGNNSSDAHVVTPTRTKDAIKCGTASKLGEMSITLKVANISKIKVYIACWNSNSENTSIDVSISSGSISPTTVELTKDSSLTGNASTFTLNGNESTFNCEFAISNAPIDAVITLSAQQAANNRFVVWGATDQFAETFASAFLSNLVCNANGTSQPTYNNEYSWSNLEAIYDNLDEEEQGKLANATASESGNDIQKAMARYDYIVGKYLKAQGLSAYNDYIKRNPAPIGAGLAVLPTVENEATGAVVTIVTLTSVAAVGGFFFLRKRRLFK